MNILFFAGECAVTYAFPQLGAAVATVRYARTAYNVAKASASFFSGDILGGGFSLVSSVVSAAGPTIGPHIPIPGISPEYLTCVNDCHREYRDGHLWMLTTCLLGCERFRS